MRKFVWEKITHKKWMCLCLLIGNILLIGVALCNPLYYHAALDRTLQSDLDKAVSSNTKYVNQISIIGQLKNNKESGLVSNVLFKGAYKDADKVCDTVEAEYGISALEKVMFTYFPGSKISDMDYAEVKDSDRFSVSHLTELKEHVDLVSGEWVSSSIDVNKPIDCVVSEHTMMSRGLMIGQKITLEQVVTAEENKPLTFKIVGIFAEKENDSYWMEDSSTYHSELFVSDEMYKYCKENVIFKGGNNILVRYHVLFDQSEMGDHNYKKLLNRANEMKSFFKGSSCTFNCGFKNTLVEYKRSRGSLRMIMMILEIPLFVLLAIFIYMVSSQMLSMEESEIAMLKSRGADRRQIISVYFMQSGILSLMAAVAGIPLSVFLSRMIGSANSFLQFVSRNNLKIRFSPDVLMFFVGAVAVSILVMVLPVIKLSRLTIVEQKQGRRKKKSSVWKRLWLDVILIAISLYGYYNFQEQKEALSMKVAEGGQMDALMLLSSSIFIMGFGLLAVRLLPKLVWVTFQLGKRFWKPELYASFLQIIRSSKKQEGIALFLVMTISLGIFNATTASTINDNQEEGIKFTRGSDIQIKEEWQSNYSNALYEHSKGSEVRITYAEQDYERYAKLSDKVDGMTRVFKNYGANVYLRSNSGTIAEDEGIDIIAIEPKSFGECCWYRNDLSKKHWYNYLNKLADNYNGILISKTMADDLDFKVGDKVDVNFQDELGRYEFEYSYGKIVGIVDYFPTMENEYAEYNKKDEVQKTNKYYMVMNFDYVMGSIKIHPYSIFIKTKDGNTDAVYDFVRGEGLKLEEFYDMPNELLISKNDPIFQATNGLLTIGFLVIMVLCVVGFLIYWILSIRSRELLFGIYRAMGLSRRELNKMLINEHIFSTLLAIVAGVFIGYYACILFVPVMEVTYLPGSRIIPLHMVFSLSNLSKLAVTVVLMVVFCIAVLMRLVSKLKIAKALKLGEE